MNAPRTLPHIASSDTHLDVPFARKDEVKALGARWSPEARKWYVPVGRDLEPFAAWISAPIRSSLVPEPSSALEVRDAAASQFAPAAPMAMPLSTLLAGVSALIARTFAEGVWTTAEISQATLRDGHVYLDLVEHDSSGVQVAKARAIVWARTARAMLPAFEQSTGTVLAAGMKVMVRAKPTASPRFGLSLEIDAIDSNYTLGDLEARKREIRERLLRDGVFKANRALAAPWDYRSVLVVAPQGAAGLGDFEAESRRLERAGVCTFVIVTSRFQGEGAAAEIREALARAFAERRGAELPDAVAIIRGGGAANDLAWLNDYALARFICDCPVPVLTGIGHERDSTVLDEVAHRSFDTPSKLILGIEEVIRTRAREARRFFDTISATAQRDLDRLASSIDRERDHVLSGARGMIQRARAVAADSIHTVHALAIGQIKRANNDVLDAIQEVRAGGSGKVKSMRDDIPALMSDIRTHAHGQLVRAAAHVERDLQGVMEAARSDTRRARASANRHLDDTCRLSRQSLRRARDDAQGVFREIAGQGPDRTLNRGFALATRPDGRALTRASDANEGDAVHVRLRDGVLRTRVEGVEPDLRPSQDTEH